MEATGKKNIPSTGLHLTHLLQTFLCVSSLSFPLNVFFKKWASILNNVFKILFIYLFMFIFGCAGSSLLCGFVSEGRGHSLAVVHGLLFATAPLVEHRLRGVPASGAATRGHSSGSSWALPHRSNSCGHQLSCSAALNNILILFLILKYILNIFLCHRVFFSSSSV